MPRGIAVAGTALADRILTIPAYPSAGELTVIRSLQTAVGGCVPNVAVDLRILDPTLPVFAAARVGRDENGALIERTLSAHGVHTGNLRKSEAPTDFTEVMSVPGGQRTFFTYSGAGGEFSADDLDFDTLPVSQLHLGYFLLLPRVDAGEGEKILAAAKARGIRTSIDLVSEHSDRYRSVVLPVLPLVDDLIINETEAGALTGLPPEPAKMREAAEILRAAGAGRVIIHFKTGAVCLSDEGFCTCPAIDIPRERILGTTGAGDAFCAGALLAIERGARDPEILEIASVAALGALLSPDATGGMKPLSVLRKMAGKDKKGN